ncbi:uroporphyrinogen-III C-methyltransferase [Roseicella frigidaeris]|uniref:uroporphyrinogen-III C-methyltransferase n=1 Tax=Roseicella frigidaeris TaxID=2230885 RepID=A0A327LX05_9PROT|nr:uroporphyrinogen-III C-methyltransferase [Roseicella frigidaeris]RAI55189.1 uroporphyrinogen-III C-methyltransferase [Roseicella frigidaeris]
MPDRSGPGHGLGPVHLVGAGPGDPELLTVRARRLLERAEAVVFDRLVSPEVLALAPPAALRLDVGKAPGRHRASQDEINALLVDLARSGLEVVRLKGGDPFTFGRGGEEAAHLRRHGIRVEVVPGVTSASGCAAALGLPLTQRGLAHGLRYVTGHGQDGVPLELDWAGLADPDTTLVVYMGLGQIGRIADRLLAAGLPATTPAAAVQSGTTPRQRHLVATLGTLAGAAAALRGEGPVLFIIGRVVALAPAEQSCHALASA